MDNPRMQLKALKKSPMLSADWTKQPAILSLVENVDNDRQLSVALRTISELKLFRFDRQYSLQELTTVREFPPLDSVYDRIMFARFNSTRYNDLLHFSTQGLTMYRYNETLPAYEKLFYSTAFSQLRGWNRRTIDSIATHDVEGEGMHEGLECAEVIRYKPELEQEAAKLTNNTASEEIAKDSPTSKIIPEIVPQRHRTLWLHDQLDLASLLQPLNPHTGAVELTIPLIDLRTPFGIPLRKVFQYKHVDYSNELGRGWSFPLDYITLERYDSAFEQAHVYSLVRDNHQIILTRLYEPRQEATAPSTGKGVRFTIDGYPDIKILFDARRNHWLVTIDKRNLTYVTISGFMTNKVCSTWPLCGSQSTNNESQPSRWYLVQEKDSAGWDAKYFYDIVKNKSDIRLKSIDLHDNSMVRLDYEQDRISSLEILTMKYSQAVRFHYHNSKDQLLSISQGGRPLFDFGYDKMHRLSRIVYPNGVEWTPEYEEISIDPSLLKKRIDIHHDATVFYGPDYLVVVDANLVDGLVTLHIRDPLGGLGSSRRTNATKIVHALEGITRYLVHALSNLLVVTIIYDTCKDVAVLQYTEADGWQQAEYFGELTLDSTVNAGDTFCLLADTKTLRLLTVSDGQLITTVVRRQLPTNFVVHAFAHGYATYDGKMEIFLLHNDGHWITLRSKTEGNYFNELDRFLNSFAIESDLNQSIRRGMMADMLGSFRQTVVLKIPLMRGPAIYIMVRFYIMDLSERTPKIRDYYTVNIPHANMETFNYTISTKDNDTFVLGYRLKANKYHLYVKQSYGPHKTAFEDHLAKLIKQKRQMPHKQFENALKTTRKEIDDEYARIYRAVTDAIIFAFDLSLFGMLTNREGVLTGSHLITNDGTQWNKKRLDEETMRLRKVNQQLDDQYRLVKVNASDTFKIVSQSKGTPVFDTLTSKSEELQLVMPYYVQAQQPGGPVRVYFFDSHREVSTLPPGEKLNSASNQMAIVTTIRKNNTILGSVLFRCVKYFLNPTITILRGQTLRPPGEPPIVTSYRYDVNDLQLSIEGTMFRRIQIVPGADASRFGWYEQSVDLSSGQTTRRAFTADGHHMVDPKLREQEQKQRELEQAPGTKASDIDKMILDRGGRMQIVDLGPYRLVDEMVSYYGFETYEANHFGKSNHWIFNQTMIKSEENNRYLRLSQQMDTLTGQFRPLEPKQSFVVSCWVRTTVQTNVGDHLDVLTVDVLVDKTEGKKMKSKPAEIKQRIGDWNYVETILDATHFPTASKLIIVIIVAPSGAHPSIDIDHIRFSPLGLPFEANIYEPITGDLQFVLGDNGLMRSYLHNSKGKKSILFSEHGEVLEFTMNSKIMYSRTGAKPCIVEMKPGWSMFNRKAGFNQRTTIHPGGAVRVTVEDTRGNKVAMYSKVGNYEDRLSTFRYGRDNNKIEQELPPLYHSIVGTSSMVDFFGDNRARQMELQRQWEVRFDYDEKNRLTRKRTPDGGIYQYLYDRYGILRFSLHKDANETLDRVIHFMYANNGKITREALVDLTEKECTTLLDGSKVPETTNFIDTLYGAQDADPNLRHRSKFASRRIDDDQMTEYLLYDQQDQLLKKTFVVNTINTSYSIVYQYENDKLRSINYPIGAGDKPYKFIFGYNGHGEVTTIREAATGVPMFEYTYNADGMVETMKVRTGTRSFFQRNFTYNEPGFLVRLADDYLTEDVSYLETDSYGQDSYTPIYEGLISRTVFTAHWQRLASSLRTGLYPEDFISSTMNRKQAAICFDILKQKGYLNEVNQATRTFYGERDDDLPFICGEAIAMNHLSAAVSSGSFPHQYGHRYDYDDHDQLIKAKYFHGPDELLLAPLTHRTFAKEIDGVQERDSKKIWDVLLTEGFLSADCTNPNLCHGRPGIKSMFHEYIRKHRYYKHLQTMLSKAIAERKGMSGDEFDARCKQWNVGSNLAKSTCRNIKSSLTKRNFIGDRPENPLASLSDAFRDTLKTFKSKIPDIVRVLSDHFAKALGRSAGDVQSYEIDANGNHRKFYTGFSRYRLEYRDGTNQITKLHRQYFDRNQREEEHFNMEHNSDGAVVKAEHKGIKHMEYDRILHRVTKMEMQDGRKLLFQYDVRAERTFKQVCNPDGTVSHEKYYIRDAHGMVLVDMEMTYLAKDQPPDVRVTSYIYKDQQLVGFVRNDKLYGVITDHEGSVRLVVRDGEVVAAYDYLPYGQIFRRYGTDLDGQISYLYTGQEWEPETGLYNYRARLYDPDIGRFYQMDPKEQYPSPYVYAGNSPVSLVDPDGEFAFALACLIMALVGAYLGAASAAKSWNPLQWNWKSKTLWLGLFGGALTGLSIPFNMTASVSFFVGLGLSLTTSISIMVCSGITFGYFALAAATGSWDPKNFDFTSPGIWNALLGGIATSAFIVTTPNSLLTTFRSITTTFGRALFVTANVGLSVTFAYLFTVVKMGGEFDVTKWDFKDPGLYYSLFDGVTTAIFVVNIARNVPKTLQKWNKKIKSTLDRFAETEIYFRARKLMHGDWSLKLSNARFFIMANAQGIANLQRGILPIAFYSFIVTLRMAESYQTSPVPGFSVFMQIITTVITTRGFSNRVVKPMVAKVTNVPLALRLEGPTNRQSSASGADTLSSFFSNFRIPLFDWLRTIATKSRDQEQNARTTNFADEPETGEESYRPGEQEEQKHHNQGVAKVQEGGCGVLDLQLRGEVVATVHEQVDRSKAGRQERSPPPVVVFRAQMEVAQQDRRLGAGDHEDEEYQEEKTEHVVHLTRPERVQDEEQLDEDAAEWQHTAHDDARDRLRVDRLVRYLTGDLIRSNWVFEGLQNKDAFSTYPLAESKVSTHECKWDRNAEPQGQQSNQGRKRNSS
uniref:Tox-SGS domain-containing protein n=1 Tax=Anopheles atroparvus TaxID=41427 RepID=A0A182INA6_ANOAO